jgi:hypothetical protein
MIDAIAKALALWAVPYNQWDSMSEAQRDRWRDAARTAVDAQEHWYETCRDEIALYPR